MLQNDYWYSLAKIGADTEENSQNFEKNFKSDIFLARFTNICQDFSQKLTKLDTGHVLPNGGRPRSGLPAHAGPGRRRAGSAEARVARRNGAAVAGPARRRREGPRRGGRAFA